MPPKNVKHRKRRTTMDAGAKNSDEGAPKSKNETKRAGKECSKAKNVNKKGASLGNKSRASFKTNSVNQFRNNKNKSSASRVTRRLLSSADFEWEKERTKIAETKLKEAEETIEKLKTDYTKLEMENTSLFKLMSSQNDLIEKKDQVILKLSETNTKLKQGLLPQDYKENIIELEKEIISLNKNLDSKQKEIVDLIKQTNEDNKIIINQRKKVLQLELENRMMKVNEDTDSEDKVNGAKDVHEIKVQEGTKDQGSSGKEDLTGKGKNLVPMKWKTNFKLAQLNLMNFRTWKNKVIRICNTKKGVTSQSILNIPPPKIFNSISQGLKKIEEGPMEKPLLGDIRLRKWISEGFRQAASLSSSTMRSNIPTSVVEGIFKKNVSLFKSEIKKAMPPFPKSLKTSSPKLKTFSDWSNDFKADIITEVQYGAYALNDCVKNNVSWVKRKRTMPQDFINQDMKIDGKSSVVETMVGQEIKRIRNENTLKPVIIGRDIPVIVTNR